MDLIAINNSPEEELEEVKVLKKLPKVNYLIYQDVKQH